MPPIQIPLCLAPLLAVPQTDTSLHPSPLICLYHQIHSAAMIRLMTFTWNVKSLIDSFRILTVVQTPQKEKCCIPEPVILEVLVLLLDNRLVFPNVT